MKRLLKYLLISVLVLLNVYTVVDLFATNFSKIPDCYSNYPDLTEGCAYCLCGENDPYPWCIVNDCWSFGWEAPPFPPEDGMGYCKTEDFNTWCYDPIAKRYYDITCYDPKDCIISR